MEKKRRKILYYTFIAIFILGSAYLIIITQGLTIDWKKLTITKTGAVYIRSTPSDAEIYVDNKQYKSEDGIINKGTLIKNLKSGTYEVVVKKDGFSPWIKNITVEKGVVSSESFIRLWKTDPETEKIASSSIKNFWVTSEGIILQDNTGDIRIDNNIIRGINVISYSITTGGIITKDKNNTLFFVDIADPNTAINIQELFNSLKQRELKLPGTVKILTALPHPFSHSKIIVATKTSLYIIDLKKISIEKILGVEHIDEVFSDDTRVFIKDAQGNIAMVNLLIKNEPEIMYASSTEMHIPVLNNSYLLFIGEQNTLFIYNRVTKDISTIAKNVKYFSLSPEEKRVGVVFENGTLGIAYITDYSGNIQIKKGMFIPLLLNGSAKNIKFDSLEWLRGFQNYIVALAKDSVWAIETDEKNLQNAVLLSQNIKKYIIQDNFYFLDINGELRRVTY